MDLTTLNANMPTFTDRTEARAFASFLNEVDVLATEDGLRAVVQARRGGRFAVLWTAVRGDLPTRMTPTYTARTACALADSEGVS